MPTGTRPETGESQPANLLDAQLARLGLDRTRPPQAEDWLRLLDGIEDACSALAATSLKGVESILDSQVAQRRSRQTNLFDQSPVPILQLDLSAVADPSGSHDLDRTLRDIELTATNQAAATLLGIDAHQPVGLIDVGDVGVAKEAWAVLIEMVRSGSIDAEFEFRGTGPDGRSFEALLLAAVPTPFDIPDYTRVVVSMTDISTHKAEERRMHDLVTSKNRLLASVTDDLRSPLAEVINFAHLLEGPMEDPRKRRDLAVAIADGATRVAGIVEDLLVISRCELGDLSVVRVPVDLSAQVAQVLEVGGTRMSDVATPGRRVERRLCMGDPAWVRQIIRNLVTDAVTHGGEGVSVTIHRRGTTLYLRVTCDAPALPSDLSERVFGPFDDLTGAPIGPDARFMALSVARRLAVAMDGGLGYRHDAGRTEFEVCLPAAQLD